MCLAGSLYNNPIDNKVRKIDPAARTMAKGDLVWRYLHKKPKPPQARTRPSAAESSLAVNQTSHQKPDQGAKKTAPKNMGQKNLKNAFNTPNNRPANKPALLIGAGTNFNINGSLNSPLRGR